MAGQAIAALAECAHPALDTYQPVGYVPGMPAAAARTVDRPRRGGARTALLDAALALVRRQGWAATSVEQLCEAAGVTKGAFFHHFPSKDVLGVAAARHWSEVTGPLFAGAPYHQLPDPLDRILGYLAFRAAIARGPLEAFTCFAGTTVQEVFATSDAMRAACGASILDHAGTLERDFQLAIERHPPHNGADAASLAAYTQVVLQGGFVLSKAVGGNAPLLEAIGHLESHLRLLFGRERPHRTTGKRRRNVRRPRKGE